MQGHNQYQQAINAVCNILLHYDYKKTPGLFGFGGIPNFPNLKSEKVLHCFPLNGNVNAPQVLGIEGIMNTY